MNKQAQEEGRKFINRFHKDLGPNGIQVRDLLRRLTDKNPEERVTNREFEQEITELVARYKKAGGTL